MSVVGDYCICPFAGKLLPKINRKKFFEKTHHSSHPCVSC